jgi:hypothetical protein
MPRRKSNVNQADVQRFLRACKREGLHFRATLQPHGAVVFEPAAETVTFTITDDLDRELAELEAGQ